MKQRLSFWLSTYWEGFDNSYLKKKLIHNWPHVKDQNDELSEKILELSNKYSEEIKKKENERVSNNDFNFQNNNDFEFSNLTRELLNSKFFFNFLYIKDNKNQKPDLKSAFNQREFDEIVSTDKEKGKIVLNLFDKYY